MDLNAALPAGADSLHPAKLETIPVALLNVGSEVPFIVNQSPAGDEEDAAQCSYHLPRIAGAGPEVVIYTQTSRCKLRAIHIGTGARTLLSAVDARGVTAQHSIRAVWTHPHRDGSSQATRVYAYISRADATGSPIVVRWTIPANWGAANAPSVEINTAGEVVSNAFSRDSAASPYWLGFQQDVVLSGDAATRQIKALSLDAKHPYQLAAADLASSKSFGAAAAAGSTTLQVACEANARDERIQLHVSDSANPSASASTIDLPWPSSKAAVSVTSCSPIFSPHDHTQISAVAIGFNNNTLLSIVTPAASGRHVKVTEIELEGAGAAGESFNVLKVVGQSILLANSSRASIFAIPVKIPQGSGAVWPKGSAAAQAQSQVEVLPAYEYALQEPLVSMDIHATSNSTIVYAMHPAGIQIIYLPSLDSLLSRDGHASDQASVEEAQEVSAITAAPEPVAAEEAATRPEPAAASAPAPKPEANAPDQKQKATTASAPARQASPVDAPAAPATASERVAPEGVRRESPAPPVASQAPIDKTAAPAESAPGTDASVLQAVEQATERIQQIFFEKVMATMQETLPGEITRAISRSGILDSIEAAAQKVFEQTLQRSADDLLERKVMPHINGALAKMSAELAEQVSSEMAQIREDAVAEESTALEVTNEEVAILSGQVLRLQKQVVELQEARATMSTGLQELMQTNQEILEQVQKVATMATEAIRAAPTKPQINVEDAFLTVLSQDDVDTNSAGLRRLLADLTEQFDSGGDALRSVSQPVLLALLHRLSLYLLNAAQGQSPGAQLSASDAVPWLEVCARYVDRDDPKIANHFGAASARIIRQLWEANALLSQPGGNAPWWTAAQVSEKIMQPLLRAR